MGCCIPTENSGAGRNEGDMLDTTGRMNNNQQAVPTNQTTYQDGGATKTSKVIFMGNQNVGKTSIINCFMEKNNMRGRPRLRTNVIQDFTKVVNVTDD